TETVYGLGASAFDASAVRAVYEAKGRPDTNPMIVHVLDIDGAARVAARLDARAQALAAAFWPGPLTMVVPRAAAIPDAVTAGLETVAIRAPAHPVARALLESFGGP